MDNTGKEGSFKVIFIVMILSLVIASFWQSATWIKGPVHAVLDPTLGKLLGFNATFGMFVIVALISLFTTLVQKHMTDQKTIKELKDQQKAINLKAKQFSHDPQKMMEIQKELWPISMRLMKLGMRPLIYTSVPFILLFRWFFDIFTAGTEWTIVGDPKFFGFMNWFWFYLIFAIVIGSILRKILKVH